MNTTNYYSQLQIIHPLIIWSAGYPCAHAWLFSCSIQ